MPPRGRPLIMPDPEPVNVRASVAALPAADRPALRWYTIRDHDPVLGQVDIDIMTHGDSGPGSAWTCRARRGDPVGLRASGALYRGCEVRGRQVLVADETSVPSVAAILDSWGGAADARDQGVEVHVEVADPAVLDAYDLGDATVHERRGVPGSALVPGPRRGARATARPDPLRVGVRRGRPRGRGPAGAGAPRRRPAHHLPLRLLEARPPAAVTRHHACRSVGTSSMTTWNFSAIGSRPMP